MLPVVTPQTQTQKGFFTILEEIVLQVALPSEGQIRALLICLQGGEPAGGHFEW